MCNHFNDFDLLKIPSYNNMDNETPIKSVYPLFPSIFNMFPSQAQLGVVWYDWRKRNGKNLD